jgi:hypothetical protein
MTIKRMEHVGIVVEDIAAATAFFVAREVEVAREGGLVMSTLGVPHGR